MDVKRGREKKEEKRYCNRCSRCINFYVGDGYDRRSISSGRVLRLQINVELEKKKKTKKKFTLGREQFFPLCSDCIELIDVI